MRVIVAQGHPYYDITHNGLDALVTRYIDTFTAFASLPDALAFANHSTYEFVQDVGGNDMVEGIYKAVTMFEGARVRWRCRAGSKSVKAHMMAVPAGCVNLTRAWA